MTIIYRILFFGLFLTLSLPVQGMDLNDVLENYRKTLPVYPKKGASIEETALQAIQFVFQFMEHEKRDELEKPISTIDLSFCGESLMDYMSFHTYYRDELGTLRFKEERDQHVGSIYKSVLTSLKKKVPVVGYVYYHGFKSANIYEVKTGKGKVLSRNVDLQERINYETYKYLREGLQQLGIDFRFVVLRDTFHALTFKLDACDKIYKEAPEIFQYGQDVQKIAQSTNIKTLDFCDIKNINGESFDAFIESNLPNIIHNAKEVPDNEASNMKGFLRKEYDYESYPNKQKEGRAMERAKRYIAVIDFMRKHEKNFLIPTFMQLFGENYIELPFSTHVENHLRLCKKIPLRNMNNFIGGCNSQHQLPLLQQLQDGTYKMYTIRSDFMNKFLKERKVTLNQVSIYPTFFYKGDEDIRTLF